MSSHCGTLSISSEDRSVDSDTQDALPYMQLRSELEKAKKDIKAAVAQGAHEGASQELVVVRQREVSSRARLPFEAAAKEIAPRRTCLRISKGR